MIKGGSSIQPHSDLFCLVSVENLYFRKYLNTPNKPSKHVTNQLILICTELCNFVPNKTLPYIFDHGKIMVWFITCLLGNFQYTQEHLLKIILLAYVKDWYFSRFHFFSTLWLVNFLNNKQGPRFTGSPHSHKIYCIIIKMSIG